ncbi:hypothetical protein A1O3_09081 [Capronia epimyces CBS 606.96]|uniref:Uncharacterized protein n=1 Tax=Capronia epimyces CBS 606.96 TaxID=1182542 RepID=W9XBS7_9EURO|nr:uncharacterized protein A1O3_09081 [Capronia epimyces CBS 606.96]EXJ77922.1 hypothetical protein A1O3_09081 [Capronia epimyces CBS 606.96]
MAQHTVQQLCETIDAKLRLAQAQRRPSEPAYPPTYSAPSSSSYAIPSGFQSATTLDISPRTSMSQDTCTRASSNLECKKSDTSKYTVHHHHHGHPRPRPQLETVISWTSNATRRKEYAKIDRAHSGVRGFLRRLVPRCVCKTARKGFFTGYCDGNSVRRFRMNVCGENGAESEDDETEAEEKQDPVARDAVAEPKTVAVAVAVDEREQQERKEGHESPRSRWTCLQ